MNRQRNEMVSKGLFNAVSKLYGFFGAGVKLADAMAVLIIGGSSDGLGTELIVSLAIDYNIHVVNIYSKDIELILDSKEANLLAAYYTFVPCKDFTNSKYLLEALKKVKDLQLPITILINNMQQGIETTFSSSFFMGHSAVARLQEYISANVTSVMVTTKYFLTLLVPQTDRILETKAKFYVINLTSILTEKTPGFAIEYVSSKAALNQFHDGLTSELAMSSKRNRFKTLLIYLPYAKDGRSWEILSTDLCEQVIEHLRLGQKGCTTLQANGAKSMFGKVKNNYRYTSGRWKREWLN